MNDFCQIAGAPVQNTEHEGASSASLSCANHEAQVISASTGKPLDWRELEKAAGLQRALTPSGSNRQGGLQTVGGGVENGWGSRRSSGGTRGLLHARHSSGGASAKRRRDGGAGSDTDSDGETAWTKALKQAEYLERVEKQETYKQRRMAEQAALNERFFETKKKREEPVLGVDVNAPLLPDGWFSDDDEDPLMEKVSARMSHCCVCGTCCSCTL